MSTLAIVVVSFFVGAVGGAVGWEAVDDDPAEFEGSKIELETDREASRSALYALCARQNQNGVNTGQNVRDCDEFKKTWARVKLEDYQFCRSQALSPKECKKRVGLDDND